MHNLKLIKTLFINVYMNTSKMMILHDLCNAMTNIVNHFSMILILAEIVY